jgi:hypothetical protein
MASKEGANALKEIGGPLSASLANKDNSARLKQAVRSYVDAHSKVLLASHPGNRLYFREADEDALFKAAGVSREDVDLVIKRYKLADSTWRILNRAFYWAGALAVRHYLVSKDEEGAQHALIYLVLPMYASLQFKYWKHEPSGHLEAVMEYTVNNLSNKFKLKEMRTIIATLQYTANSTLEKYKDGIIKGDDEELRYFLSQLWIRINGFLQSVANEFYSNVEKGNHLYIEKEPGEDSFREVDNVSMLVARLSESSFNRAVTGGVDTRTATAASTISGVSTSAIRSALEKINSEKSAEVKELITLTLQMYFSDGKRQPDTVGTNQFLVESIKNLTKSNTKEEAVLRTKDILDDMLLTTSEKYNSSERPATRANFRKAIYIYYVILIQQTYMGN